MGRIINSPSVLTSLEGTLHLPSILLLTSALSISIDIPSLESNKKGVATQSYILFRVQDGVSLFQRGIELT